MNVSVTAGNIKIVRVSSPGIRGLAGPTGPRGAAGTTVISSSLSNVIITGSLWLSGSPATTETVLTASGHISSSGNLTVNNISASGNIYASTYNGLEDEHLDIKSDKNIRLYLDKDNDTAASKFSVLDGGGTVRFQVQEDGETAIGGNVDATSNFVKILDGNVTASGNISASGNYIGVSASFHYLTTTGDISASGTVYANNFTSTGGDANGISFTDDLNITGDITASGDILLGEDQRIYFESAKNTYIETDAADRIRFVVGGSQMLLLDQDDGRVNIGYGHKLGVGLGNHTIPGEALEVAGNISASGTITASGIHASGPISSSGTITAEHFYSSDDLEVEDQIKSKTALFNPDSTSVGDFRVKSLNLNHVLYTDANKDKVGIAWQNPAGSELLSSLHIDGDITVNTHITASGNISASGTVTALSASFNRIDFQGSDYAVVFSGSVTQTGSIGHMIVGDQSIQLGGVGGTRFTKTDIDNLKSGKSIRDIEGLSAKTYTLDDGREIGRQYEQRFNRWAPNLSFEDTEAGDAVSADFSETDSIPQSYVDLTDRQYTAVIQQGLTKYVQTTADIALSSSATAASTINVKSPNISLTSGRTDNMTLVSVTGSLSISGSGTLSNWGNFKNRMHMDRHYFTVTTDPWSTGGWKDLLGHPKAGPSGSAPHLHFQLSGSGQAGVGLLNPEHTLHVSASSDSFNALQVEGQSKFNGFVGGNAFGNPTTISTPTVIPAGYNSVLWVTTATPSITIAQGVNFTVHSTANTQIVNMDVAF